MEGGKTKKQIHLKNRRWQMLSCIKPKLIKPRNVARVAVMAVLIVYNSCITDWAKSVQRHWEGVAVRGESL